MSTVIERGKKFSRDQYTNLNEEQKERYFIIDNNGPKKGMYCQVIDEPLPTFEEAPCETVIEGKNNSYIVLGRDRPASMASGYGGGGFTQCGMIDLVVGRGAMWKNEKGKRTIPNKDTLLAPNFFGDAARIYISQKCNIDEYFGIAMGSERTRPISERSNSQARSGVGIHADHIRVFGRRHIKIVTGRAVAEGVGPFGMAQSQGGENFGDPGGIDLIAGNYTEDENISTLNKLTKIIGFDDPLFGGDTVAKLQPVVKGHNMAECIRHIDRILHNMHGMILANSTSINQVARGTSRFIATRLAPGSRLFAASLIPPKIKSIQTLAATFNDAVNSVGLETNFLDENSPLYISSNHVRTT